MWLLVNPKPYKRGVGVQRLAYRPSKPRVPVRIRYATPGKVLLNHASKGMPLRYDGACTINRLQDKTTGRRCMSLQYPGVAQLVAHVIWDHGVGSSSLPTRTIWPVSQAVKTPGFHSGNTGSTPVPATKIKNRNKEDVV